MTGEVVTADLSGIGRINMHTGGYLHHHHIIHVLGNHHVRERRVDVRRVRISRGGTMMISASGEKPHLQAVRTR